MQGDIRPLRQTSRRHAVVRPALKPVRRDIAHRYRSLSGGGVRSIELVRSKPVSSTTKVSDTTAVNKTSTTAPVNSLAKSAEPTVNRSIQKNQTYQKAPDEVLETVKVSKSPTRRIFSGHRLIYGAAVVVFVAGIGIVLQGLIVNRELVDQVQALSSKSDNSTGLTNSSDEVPSEEKPPPNSVGTYRVAADMPRVISLPSLGVKARVLQVGVDKNNQLLAPKNVFDTAWYTGSSKPGEAGSAVIDGHYSGVNTKGVFSQIKRLKNGDKIDIERGDGKVLTFTIRQVETVAADTVDMGKLLVPFETSLPGLNLITCGGKFDASTHRFSDRTVVYSVLE